MSVYLFVMSWVVNVVCVTVIVLLMCHFSSLYVLGILNQPIMSFC